MTKFHAEFGRGALTVGGGVVPELDGYQGVLWSVKISLVNRQTNIAAL